MNDEAFDTIIGDLRRISAWLAEDTGNQEAQGAASDLLNAADWLEAEVPQFND